MPLCEIHSRVARLTNSGPLSERRNSGAPCTLTSLDRTSMTRLERIELATSMARHSRVNSSTTVRHLICWPVAVAVASKTRSLALTPAWQLQAGLAPQPVRPVHARLVAGAAREDADAPVALAWVRARQGLHRFDRGRVFGRQAKLVAQARARDADEPAGTPLGQAAFARERDCLAPRLRARHLLALISLRTEMSRSRSASRRLSRAFSASRVRRRLTSDGASSPKCLRQE